MGGTGSRNYQMDWGSLRKSQGLARSPGEMSVTERRS